MNTKRKLIILAIAAAAAACAAPKEKPQSPPASAQAQPPSSAKNTDAIPAEKPAAKPAVETGGAVVMSPDHPVAMPAAEATPAAPVQMKMPEEPRTPSPAPPIETAPAPKASPPAPPAQAAAATPSKAMTVVADTTAREFALNVGKKDPSHPFYGRGHEMGFIVDGVQGKELVLTRGVPYVFHVDTNVQHDFYFTTSPAGRGAGTVTDGIKGQFTYRGTVTFTPGASSPDLMYYQCRNHQYMGGKIHIANAGDKVAVGGEPMAGPVNMGEQPAVTAAQVKQKLSYAEMVLAPAAKRVASSDNAEAKKRLDQAKQQLVSANAALNVGDNAAAMQAANEALRLVSAAAHLVPSEAGQGDENKARYAEALDQLHGFDKSYQKNLARGMKPKSGKVLDKTKFDALVKEAEGLAAKNQYEEGISRLKSANELLTAALAALLDSQTVVYDKSFATPQEEYEFELSRYGSYVDLIPLAIEQRKPSDETLATMDELVKRAKEIHDEGAALAAKGDHKMAIMALQAATERLQQALHLAGVQ